MAFEQRSSDGTIKRAYRLLKDNTLIESVLMPYEDGRRTACISSQAGCAMACAFCATGQQGFTRQLTDSEIFEQALLFSRDLSKEKGERLSNVVFMGASCMHHYGVDTSNHRDTRVSTPPPSPPLPQTPRHPQARASPSTTASR